MTAETTTARDPEVRVLTAALSAPFDPKEIKFKPQMVKNNRALAMAYIDARLIQDRLDEVVGVENWEDAYKILPDGGVMCRLRVKLGDRWIAKTDVGSPSEQPDLGDRLKAAFSDALKRTAAKFGIGRYLHRLPAQRVGYDAPEKQDLGDRLKAAFSDALKRTAVKFGIGRSLYRLPAQWVDYDAQKKQIVQPPQLPAFALPKAKAAAKVAVEPTKPKEEPAAPVPTHAAAKPAAASLPADGRELHRRLRDYDAKLAAQKLCPVGALLAHVTQAGV